MFKNPCTFRPSPEMRKRIKKEMEKERLAFIRAGLEQCKQNRRRLDKDGWPKKHEGKE